MNRNANGKLSLGLTRGDGSTGEDVSPNVRTVRSVPLVISAKTLDKAGLPPKFEVRGELLMPLPAFQRMNEEREGQGLSLFAYPHKATNGTVRTLEPNVTRSARLDFFAYGLLADGRPDLRSQFQSTQGSDCGRIQGESTPKWRRILGT